MRLLLVLFLAFAAPPAYAQDAAPTTSESVLSELYGCLDVADDAQRLACSDGAIARLRRAENEGHIVAFNRQQVTTIERESFGFTLPNLGAMIWGRGEGGREQVEDIELEVARVEERTGRLSYVMSNGQTWVQVEALQTRNVRAGDTVTVRRGALGTFLLISERGGQAQRVRRQN